MMIWGNEGMKNLEDVIKDKNRDGEDAGQPDGGEESEAGAVQPREPVLGLVDQSPQNKGYGIAILWHNMMMRCL